MDVRDLKQDIDDGKLASFYVFVGPERGLMRKYIRRIDETAKEADAFTGLIARFQNSGLFKANHGTFFIYNDKSALEMDVKDIVRITGSNIVILIYDSADMRMKFFKDTKNYTYDFPRYDSETLSRYVRGLVDVDQKLAIELCELCNNEIDLVDLECDKLNRLNVRITRELLHEIITKRAEDVIFDMIRAVAVRDKSEVYSFLDELLERRESPIKIISLLYTTFRNILIIQAYQHLQNNEISSKTGLSSGQIYHQRELVGRFTLEDLKDILILIQEAEVAIKTGKLDQMTALDVLLINILK